MATLGEKVQATFTSAVRWGIEILLDALGKAFAPKISPLISMIEQTGKVPPELQPLLNEMKSPTGEIGALLSNSASSALIGGAIGMVMDAVFLPVAYALNAQTRNRLMGMGELLTAWHRDPTLEGKVDQELSWLGFLDEDIKRFKDLSWIIPGPGDLVRMAVREAFTPKVIKDYDLGADFPPEFAEFAEKVGLKEEWAKRYWYSHWVLPSINQGYEMLHRGQIDEGELRDLLTYQDVLPWWHDKLLAISYRPYTRVDVRRMYALDVLKPKQVKDSYLALGYDEEKAENMAQFTFRFQTSGDRDLTKADILGAYRKRSISPETARELLREIDYGDDEIDFLLAKEDQGATATERDLTISQYKQLYVAGIQEKAQVTPALAERGFSQEEILLLYQLWDLDRIAKPRQPTRGYRLVSPGVRRRCPGGEPERGGAGQERAGPGRQSGG